MYKVIAIIGEAGSGKDTILNEIYKKFPFAFNKIVSYTTRPKRDNEEEGKDYYYISEKEFEKKVLNNEMLESSFHHWYYGTGIKALVQNKINIGVFNIDGIVSLLEHPEIDLKIYYILAEAKTRIKRQLDRENSPDIDEIFRRYSTDKEDFLEENINQFKINNNMIILTNEDISDLNKNVNMIISDIILWSF